MAEIFLEGNVEKRDSCQLSVFSRQFEPLPAADEPRATHVSRLSKNGRRTAGSRSLEQHPVALEATLFAATPLRATSGHSRRHEAAGSSPPAAILPFDRPNHRIGKPLWITIFPPPMGTPPWVRVNA